MRKLFILIILTLNVGLLSGQNNTGVGFLGRYVEWIGDDNPNDPLFPERKFSYPYPTYAPSTTYNIANISANPRYVIGFYTKEFYIDVIYDTEMNGDYANDILEAVKSFNSKSTFIKFNVSGENLENADLSSNESTQNMAPINTIKFDNNRDELSGNSDVSAKTVPNFVTDCGSPPIIQSWTSIIGNYTNTNTDFGSIIIGGDIIINADKLFDTGLNPGSNIHFRTVILHELCHLAGLNHASFSNKIDLMHRKIEKNKVKYLTGDALKAINALYGKEGLNAVDANDVPIPNRNPHTSIYGCSEFDQNIKGLAVDDNGFNSESYTGRFGNASDPCTNCLQDITEEGLDCGGNCTPCGIYCSDLPDNKNYNEDDIVPNVTAVTDYITAGNNSGSTGSLIIPSRVDGILFQAGEYIEISPGFETTAGSEISMNIENCEYRPICDFPLPNVMTPNCDGDNDYLGFFITGATDYEVWIIGEPIGPGGWGKSLRVIYYNFGQVNGNYVRVWDGRTVNVGPSGTRIDDAKISYYYLIRFHNSYTGEWKGDPREPDSEAEDFHFFHVLDNNGDNYPCDDDGLSFPGPGKRSEDANIANNDSDIHIKVYPNPTSDFVNVTNLGRIKSISVFDVNMKCLNTIPEKDILSSSIQIDLTSYAAGTYYIVINKYSSIESKKVVLNE